MFCFVAAIPMTCNGGVYLFTLMDWHTASWATLLIGCAEVSAFPSVSSVCVHIWSGSVLVGWSNISLHTQIVIISWVYGIQRSFENLVEMGMRLGPGLRYYWWLVWVVLSPAACVVSRLVFLLVRAHCLHVFGHCRRCSCSS